MHLATLKTGLITLGTSLLVIGMIMSGLMMAPNQASAFWWPWGDHHAYAQGQDHDDDTVTVSIHKYIDGEMATADSADDASFPMTATWDDPEDGAGSGSYSLSVGNDYSAQTSAMQAGADYATEEVLDGDTVATSCSEGHPYKLVGYSTGVSMEAAASAAVTGAAPAFTDLTEDHHVIVWNETCDDGGEPAPVDGEISGEVIGGQDEEPGELIVTSIDALKTTAVANGEFDDGWQYLFNITIPTDEPELAMKFADWMQTDGPHMLAVANNMRISSDQADNGGATVLLTAADTYSSPDLTMVSDLDSGEDGLQVQVLVEVAVPSDTYNGTYTTEYGVRTLP